MTRTQLAKRLSFLVCNELCKQIATNKCIDCEIAKLINDLAFVR